MSFDEDTFVGRLREEANEVKRCFTSFSFQTIAFSSVILGLVIRFLPETPLVCLASLPVVLLVNAVCRIGAYKYATSNRNFGYELHLSRTAHLQDLENAVQKGCWTSHMRESIGWEEALRAWRIVQTTVFRVLYETPETTPECTGNLIEKFFHWRAHWAKRYRLKRNVSDKIESWHQQNSQRTVGRDGYPWFCPKELAKHGGAHYYAGSYLKRMFWILDWFQMIAILTVVAGGLVMYARDQKLWGSLLLATAGLSLLVIWHWRVRLQNRRDLLENGLLSIHSCAVMWQAVVLCHFRALRATRDNPYVGYTIELASEAKCLARVVNHVHRWVVGDYFDERGEFIEGAGQPAAGGEAFSQAPQQESQGS